GGQAGIGDEQMDVGRGIGAVSTGGKNQALRIVERELSQIIAADLLAGLSDLNQNLAGRTEQIQMPIVRIEGQTPGLAQAERRQIHLRDLTLFEGLGAIQAGGGIRLDLDQAGGVEDEEAAI